MNKRLESAMEEIYQGGIEMGIALSKTPETPGTRLDKLYAEKRMLLGKNRVLSLVLEDLVSNNRVLQMALKLIKDTTTKKTKVSILLEVK